MEALDKANKIWADEVAEAHQQAANSLKLKRLTKDQKVELFKTIRFSFMKHEDLLALTTNKTFELAK